MTLLVCCALSAQDSPAKVYDESLDPMTQIDQAASSLPSLSPTTRLSVKLLRRTLYIST